MKQLFYYIRTKSEKKMIDKKKREVGRIPLAIVCLIKWKDGNISRGVSLCSELDHFEKRKGRSIACDRAAGLPCKSLSDPLLPPVTGEALGVYIPKVRFHKVSIVADSDAYVVRNGY